MPSARVEFPSVDLDADILARMHPHLRAFYAFWDEARAGRRLPSIANVDPALRPDLGPSLIIVDRVPDDRRFVYRYVGAEEVRMRGNDPTGQSVPEAFFGVSVDSAVGNYTLCAERCIAVLDECSASRLGGSVVQERILFLPLASDGEQVDAVLVCTAWDRG